eukprot:scaffold286992_cov31-Tisochrysis_lutea.AAC.1
MRKASVAALGIAAWLAGARKVAPAAPQQFSARIEITAHQLNATAEYPPYKRYLTVYFDFAVRFATNLLSYFLSLSPSLPLLLAPSNSHRTPLHPTHSPPLPPCPMRGRHLASA